MHEQMFKDLPSSKCPGSVGRSMLDLESRGQGSIPTKDGVIFCFKFYNPNLHNIARSDRIRFKTKNPTKACAVTFEVASDTVMGRLGSDVIFGVFLY